MENQGLPCVPCKALFLLINRVGVATTGLLRFCDTLRRTDNADTAEAIMQYMYMKHGERAGYFRIAAIRERPA